MPDVETVVIQWLSGRSEMAGVTVASRVPTSYDGSQKVVRVVRLGGGIDNSLPFLVDNARLDVDCYSHDAGTAHDLMAVVRKLILHDLKWTANLSAYSASVHETTEYVGPQWFDEPGYLPAGRYLIQVGVSLKPVP